MKDIITSREEVLWAKLAGRNVDLSTMTPPVASNLTEKLMLETAERIGTGGTDGGSDYIIETTITLDMEHNTMGIADVELDIADVVAAVKANKTVRVIAENVAYHVFISAVATQIIGDNNVIFNGVMFTPDNSPACFIVEASDHKDSDPKAIEFTLNQYPIDKTPLVLESTVSGSIPNITVNITDSLSDIYAAALEEREVCLDVQITTGNTVRMPLRAFELDNGDYDLTFSVVLNVGANPVLYSVNFENTQTAQLEGVTLAVTQ